MAKKVRGNVQAAHAALKAIGHGETRIWITELGFPVETWDLSHLAVTPSIQAELVT